MKKFLAMLLILVIALPFAPAVAEGNMTDKAISFAEFTFGDTFSNIRNLIKCNSLDFKYGAYTSRCMADAIDTLPDYNNAYEEKALCFMVREKNRRNVADYAADACLWFYYPADALTDENSAVFYAGEYKFDTQGDHSGVFADLKQKLTLVYGEPFYDGNDICAAVGGPGILDMARYNNDVINYDAQYAVWKSSASNTMAVLKYYVQFGNSYEVKLAYISDIADDTFAQLSTITTVSVNDNGLQGL